MSEDPTSQRRVPRQNETGVRARGGAEDQPWLVTHWRDPEGSGAEGWVVLDRIINQVAGGGIFIRADATLREVADVARNMTYKFTVTDPQIGGAKAGIRFDPGSASAVEVMERFLVDHAALLRNVWVTGADLNTREEDVGRILRERLGLSTCQTTLARRLALRPGGHDLSDQLGVLLRRRATRHFPLVEAAVGYGLAEAIGFVSRDADGPPAVALQGFGAVGSTAAWYLERNGLARVVGIADAEGWVADPEGLPMDELLTLRTRRLERLAAAGTDARELGRRGKSLFEHLEPGERRELGGTARSAVEGDYLEAFLGAVRGDVFSPCALRYQVTERLVEALSATFWRGARRRFLVGGANNMLGRRRAGRLEEDRDGRVLAALRAADCSVVPDWVSNSGTAQFFHVALGRDLDPGAEKTVDEVLTAVGSQIRGFLAAAAELPPSAAGRADDLYARCLRLARERLESPVVLEYAGLGRTMSGER